MDAAPEQPPAFSIEVAAGASTGGDVGGSSSTLTFDAASGASTRADVTLEVAPHLTFWDALRVGGVVMGTLTIGDCCTSTVRALLTVEYALHRGADAEVWLGLGLGASFLLSTLEPFLIGGATAVSLDVALPLSRGWLFDVVVRAGFDDYGGAVPFGQLGLGFTFR
jgi:hypothetical protein